MPINIRKLCKQILRENRSPGRRQDCSTIGSRARLAARIQKAQINRQVALYTWSRDCDGCESDGMELLPASPRLVERRIDQEYDGAEGPVAVRILEPTEYEGFQASFRDAGLEAFEDGHAHCIHGGSPRY